MKADRAKKATTIGAIARNLAAAVFTAFKYYDVAKGLTPLPKSFLLALRRATVRRPAYTGYTQEKENEHA